MSSISLSPAEAADLRARHHSVLHKSIWQRWGTLIVMGITLTYLAVAYVMFGVGPAFQNANWERAGVSMQGWYSWRAQPRMRFQDDGTIEANWGNRSPLGRNPTPDWVVTSPDGREMTVIFGNEENRLEITTTGTIVWIDGIAWPVEVTEDRVAVPEGAPSGIRADAGKVVVQYGFVGEAEIRDNHVRVQRRFFGWPNFFFDTDSAFFGKSGGEVIGSFFSGERIDPAHSNLGLAVRDFFGNIEWQHADILAKLLQTIVMAFVGTVLATVVAMPLAFIAARNITRARAANFITKRFFDFLRSVDMLIWALFFTRGFGPGPLAGISAIFFTDTGTLGKLYSEALENVDDKQREGVRAVGAPSLAVQRYGVMPQVMPVFLSQALYFWESNTRSATIIGAVGAGGIGLKLMEAMRTNQSWDKVAYMVLLILIVVFVFDGISNRLRSRLIGGQKGA